ncbi:hypothetical protein RSW31_26650, partial [Escherichia coli]|uniref:hypothetical protein n=1 Tax=Escherichia coli TaxID=562 RepID=UPI0028DD96F3
TAAKRERLLARNAILRSTGFIEVQHSAAVIGATREQRVQCLQARGGRATYCIALPAQWRAFRAALHSPEAAVTGPHV